MGTINLSDDAAYAALYDLMGCENKVQDAKFDWELESDEGRKGEREQTLEEARKRRNEQIALIKTFPYIVVKQVFEVRYAVERELGQRFKIHQEVLDQRTTPGQRYVADDIEDELKKYGL